MELNLHAIATKCFVTGREFEENDPVVSYLVREANGDSVRRDVLLSEDANFVRPAFVFCRWTVGFKHRKAEENSAQTLKLTSENLFLTLAPPAEGYQNTLAEGEIAPPERDAAADETNTPLLQFLALMLERKKAIKPIGKSADGRRTVYEHRGTKNRYEVPIGDLNVEFFQKIQEHLGVLVGTGKKKKPEPEPAAAAATAPAVEAAPVVEDAPAPAVTTVDAPPSDSPQENEANSDQAATETKDQPQG